jgi:lysophospholipase L1-like esterase
MRPAPYRRRESMAERFFAMKRFLFKGDAADPSWIRVRMDEPFDEKKGYGFEPGSSDSAFAFSISAEEGNYRVSVELGDPVSAASTTVRSETRRLMLPNTRTAPGESKRAAFIANVRNARLPPPEPNAPGGTRVLLNPRETGALHWDDKLNLEFSGECPSLVSLEVEKADELPTVFLTGDSTVTDQAGGAYASWGQMLPAFFRPVVAVANHAESGETLKSFIAELRLAKILQLAKAGDYLFLQFGHNDQKSQWPQTYAEAMSTYKAYLRVYIEEARLRKLTPVLVTSTERCNFDAQGKIVPSHGDYPKAVRELALEQGVSLIDLERMSRALYEALGPGRAPEAFAPGDKTHHSEYGAFELAKCVAAEIRRTCPSLAAHLVEGFTGFDPAAPDPIESLPFIRKYHWSKGNSEKPRGN